MTLEGGIRVPFLMQWKSKLPAGQTYQQPVMAFDIHATALAAAGGTVSSEKPLDGVDLLPFLTGELQAAYDAWSAQMMPAQWVRQDARNAGAAAKGAGAPAAARIEQAFKAADKNNDGKLTAEEYPQPGIFKDVDKDGDGFATPEEVRGRHV